MNNKNRTHAKKGDFVQIHLIILKPEERVKKLPESTKRVPYEAWVKGILIGKTATIGDTVRIKSFIGREITGTLASINPSYNHGFGDPQPELVQVGLEAWLGDQKSKEEQEE